MARYVTRPPHKKQHVVSEIRKRIVSGRWPAGHKLRSRAELVQEFGVSTMTVQSAMDELVRDGFVETKGRIGTFVAEAPPHLSTYGIALPGTWSSTHEHSRLVDVLAHLAEDVVPTPPEKFVTYRGVGPRGLGAETRERLMDDVRSHRIAGLFHAMAPGTLRENPLWDVLKSSGTPVVAFGRYTAQVPVPVVSPVNGTFYDRALSYLAERGAKRTAWFSIISAVRSGKNIAEAMLSARGVDVPPHLLISANPLTPWSMRNCAQLLMKLPLNERPDTVVICDDNLVRDVTEGFAAAGVRSPDDVEIVAHANYPDRPPAALPVRLLGFDAAAVLRGALESLRVARGGKKPKRETTVSAMWEEEYERGQVR